MSFYGNILNRLDHFWRKIKIGNTTLEANENDIVEIIGNEGIVINGDAQTKKITINGSNLKMAIEANNANKSDGYSMVYTFKQGNANIGTINIPLQSILKEAELVNKNANNEPGSFIKLVFRTEEGTGESIIYINVADLNEDQDIIKLTNGLTNVTEDLENVKQDLKESIAVTNGTLVIKQGESWG